MTLDELLVATMEVIQDHLALEEHPDSDLIKEAAIEHIEAKGLTFTPPEE